MTQKNIVNLTSINPLAVEAAKLEYAKETDSNKADLWDRMGEQLEIQNYPKDQIAKKISGLIEINLEKILLSKGVPAAEAKELSKFKSGYFHRRMSEKGYTDKTFVRNETNQSPQGDNTNSSDEKLNSKSQFSAQRYDDIILIQKMRKFLSMCEDELEKNYDEVKQGDEIVKIERDWTQFYDADRVRQHDFMKNLFANFFDEWSRQLSTKQSLLPKMWILSASIMGCGVGISDFCSNYFAKVKNKTAISTKAWRKFITEVNNFSEYMHFIQDDAWKWSVLPIPCPHCKKQTLRTKIDPNGTWEFICTNKKAHKNESQPRFSPNVFRKMLQKYMSNENGIGDQVVERSGIRIITNDTVKK